MIFTPEHCQLILQRLKTQTRRLQRAGDRIERAPDGSIVAVYRQGRLLWRVGRTYALQPGRGQAAVGRIRLVAIRAQSKVGEITGADVRAEGFTMPLSPSPFVTGVPDWATVPDFMRFMEVWETLHPRRGERWRDNPPVYALSFEVGQ